MCKLWSNEIPKVRQVNVNFVYNKKILDQRKQKALLVDGSSCFYFITQHIFTVPRGCVGPISGLGSHFTKRHSLLSGNRASILRYIPRSLVTLTGHRSTRHLVFFLQSASPLWIKLFFFCVYLHKWNLINLVVDIFHVTSTKIHLHYTSIAASRLPYFSLPHVPVLPALPRHQIPFCFSSLLRCFTPQMTTKRYITISNTYTTIYRPSNDRKRMSLCWEVGPIRWLIPISFPSMPSGVVQTV